MASKGPGILKYPTMSVSSFFPSIYPPGHLAIPSGFGQGNKLLLGMTQTSTACGTEVGSRACRNPAWLFTGSLKCSESGSSVLPPGGVAGLCPQVDEGEGPHCAAQNSVTQPCLAAGQARRCALAVCQGRKGSGFGDHTVVSLS